MSYFNCLCCPTLQACTCVGVGVGGAIASFIGGILLTAAVAGVVTGAVLYRHKREDTIKSGWVH